VNMTSGDGSGVAAPRIKVSAALAMSAAGGGEVEAVRWRCASQRPPAERKPARAREARAGPLGSDHTDDVDDTDEADEKASVSEPPWSRSAARRA